jgi:hypothetical protein
MDKKAKPPIPQDGRKSGTFITGAAKPDTKKKK